MEVMRTTFIIGNGIGRALNNEYFTLETGLRSAWNEFDPADQEIISQLNNGRIPVEEDDLERHHLIMSSCKSLIGLADEGVEFLNDQGKNFPILYNDYIYRVAKYFWDANFELPEHFLEIFMNYLRKNPSHVATLNYDKLLYAPFVLNNILDRYDEGYLIDGIYNTTGNFDYTNFDRKYGNTFGYYLHLHGSPVIYTDGEKIKKSNIKCELPNQSQYLDSTHNQIVLSHTKLKPEIILNSKLLEVYYVMFNIALNESNKIIVIGYSGSDIHINLAIQDWGRSKVLNNAKDCFIKVVCYNNDGLSDDFWKEKILPKFNYEDHDIEKHIKLEVERYEDILNYNFET